MITLASVINCIVYSSIFILFASFASKSIKNMQAIGATTVFTVILLIFIRMAIPLEFPFAKIYSSTDILVRIDSFFRYTSIPIINASVLSIITIVWMLGVIYNVSKLALGYYHLRESVAHMENENSETTREVLKLMHDNTI